MILGVAFALLGIAVAWPAYTHLVNVPESYLDMTLQCFRIYAVGLVFQYGYNIFPSILRAVSDSRAMTASFTVGNRIEMYLNLPCNAFQTTLATYTGQSIGANRMDQVKPLFGAFQGANHSGIPAIVATGALTTRVRGTYLFEDSGLLGYRIIWWNGLFGFGMGFLISWTYYLSGRRQRNALVR